MRIASLALLPALALAAVGACSSNDAAPGEDGTDDDIGLPADRPGADQEPVHGLPRASEPVDPVALDLGPDGPSVPDVVPSGGTCVSDALYCGADKVIGDAKTLYTCNG